MITLRLDPELEQEIENTARLLGTTKSELVRKSIYEFIQKVDKPSPWELGADIFGKYESGDNNRSADRKNLLKQKIKAKRV